MLTIHPYKDSDLDSVIGLCKDCGLLHPMNDPVKDIARKKKVNPEWFIVGEIEGRIIASSMIGYNGHRAKINYSAYTLTIRERASENGSWITPKTFFAKLVVPK